MRNAAWLMMSLVVAAASAGCGGGPSFLHTAPMYAEEGISLALEVNAKLSEGKTASGRLMFRVQGEPDFRAVEMAARAGGRILSGTVPAESLRADTLVEYYMDVFSGEDSAAFKSAGDPYRVSILTRDQMIRKSVRAGARYGPSGVPVTFYCSCSRGRYRLTSAKAVYTSPHMAPDTEIEMSFAGGKGGLAGVVPGIRCYAGGWSYFIEAVVDGRTFLFPEKDRASFVMKEGPNPPPPPLMPIPDHPRVVLASFKTPLGLIMSHEAGKMVNRNEKLMRRIAYVISLACKVELEKKLVASGLYDVVPMPPIEKTVRLGKLPEREDASYGGTPHLRVAIGGTRLISGENVAEIVEVAQQTGAHLVLLAELAWHAEAILKENRLTLRPYSTLAVTGYDANGVRRFAQSGRVRCPVLPGMRRYKAKEDDADEERSYASVHIGLYDPGAAETSVGLRSLQIIAAATAMQKPVVRALIDRLEETGGGWKPPMERPAPPAPKAPEAPAPPEPRRKRPRWGPGGLGG